MTVPEEWRFQYPIIGQLTALKDGKDVFTNYTEFTFSRCQSLKKNGDPCRSRGKIVRGCAFALFKRFDAEVNWDNVAESDALLRQFVEASHCSQHHRDNAVELFNEWLGEQQVIDSTDDDMTSDAASSSEVDVEEHYTFRKTSPSPKEETRRRSHFAEQAEHRLEFSEPQAEQDSQATLVAAVASITIADTQPAATAQKTIIITEETQVEGLGLTDLRRRGSVRDKSPILGEIYKYPTPQHMKTGVLYVYKHRTIKNLYKVGYTTGTAPRRHSQPNNCYGTDTDIVHETVDGPFAGCFKAEQIAHKILENQKLWVKKCDRCGNGHKEWFMGEGHVILQAVQLAENFLRLPAYEVVGDKMKLSEAAHAVLEPLVFSVDKLEGILATQKTEVTVIETQKDGSDSETVTASVAKDVVVTSIDTVAPEDTVPVEQEKGRKLRYKNLGGRLGALGNKAKKVGRIFSPPGSREATPEVEEAAGARQTSGTNEEMFVKMAWAVMPEEVKASYGGAAADDRPRAIADLKDMAKKYRREFGEQFKAAMAGEGGKDATAVKA